jgi:hypothetical protein
MRLYRCRLDMRACHPADISTELVSKGYPRPAFGLSPKAGSICSTGGAKQVNSTAG